MNSIFSVARSILKGKEDRKKFGQKKQLLKNTENELGEKTEALNQARKRSQTAATTLSSIRVCDVQQKIDIAKIKQEQVDFELEKVLQEMSQTEKLVQELNENMLARREHLQSLQEAINEENASNEIKNQRLTNEKRFAEQLLQKRSELHYKRVLDANLNIAKDFKEMNNENAKINEMIAEIIPELQKSKERVEYWTEKKEQMIKGLDDVELVKTDEVIKRLAELKNLKQNLEVDFQKKATSFEAKIKKEHCRQRRIEIAYDDDVSSVASLEEVKPVNSDISRSSSESYKKAEMVEFEMPMVIDE